MESCERLLFFTGKSRDRTIREIETPQTASETLGNHIGEYVQRSRTHLITYIYINESRLRDTRSVRNRNAHDKDQSISSI